MRKYKQLTLGLRYQSFAYKKQNYSISEIAKIFKTKLVTEQISGRLKKDKIIHISYETIYRYIPKAWWHALQMA